MAPAPPFGVFCFIYFVNGFALSLQVGVHDYVAVPGSYSILDVGISNRTLNAARL